MRTSMASLPQIKSSRASVVVQEQDLLATLPRTVARRMRLDATLAPSMVALRINHGNLINEMKLNHGKVLVTHLPRLQTQKRSDAKPPARVQLPPVPGGKAARNAANVRCGRRRTVALSTLLGSFSEATSGVEERLKKAMLQMARQGHGGGMPSTWDGAEEEEVALLTEDTRVIVVFQAMQSQVAHQAGQSGLARSRVKRTLEALGHVQIDDNLLQASVESSAGDGLLRLQEFAQVLAVFKRKRRQGFRARFDQLVVPGSGTVGSPALRAVLREHGFPMTAEATSELLTECGVVNDLISWEHFEAILSLVHERFGFTREEVGELEAVFDRYDFNSSGDLSPDEFASAMGALGNPTSIAEAVAAIHGFDTLRDNNLCRVEFLLAVRQFRDKEIATIRALYAQQDTDCDGIIGAEDVMVLLEKLGYTVTPEVVEQGLKWARSHAKGLFFEEALRLLEKIRKQEGFSEQEQAELASVFKRFDGCGKNRLREFELARAIDWLGYPVSRQRRLHLWCKFDADKSGWLELGEFLKLVRLLLQEEVTAARALLVESPEPTDSDLKAMLAKLGYVLPMPAVQQALRAAGHATADVPVEPQEVLQVLQTVRDMQVAQLRLHEGLPDKMVAQMQTKFGRRLAMGKAVDPTELERLVFVMIPGDARDDVARKQLHRILEDYSGESEIKTLAGLCRVVRLYRDQRDLQAWQREADAIAQLSFNSAQVAQLRQAFVNEDGDGDGLLTEREVWSVIVSLATLEPSEAEWMRGELDLLRNFIDFPRFLELIQLSASMRGQL